MLLRSGSELPRDFVELHSGPGIFHRAVALPVVLQTQGEWELRGLLSPGSAGAQTGCQQVAGAGQGRAAHMRK